MYSRRLSKLIRFHRRAGGFTQITLARRAGVSRTVVQRLERGDIMASWQNVLKILEGLGVTVEFASPRIAEFDRVGAQALERHFHALIQEVAAFFLTPPVAFEWPTVSFAMRPGAKRWLAIPGMAGGFQYWLEGSDSAESATLIVESWNRDVPGSEARHEITAEGIRFVGRIINGVDFSARTAG